MSEKIYLEVSKVSGRELEHARDRLKEAAGKLKSIANGLYNTYYSGAGMTYKEPIFPFEIGMEAEKIAEQIEDSLVLSTKKYIRVLNSRPKEYKEIDRSFRADIKEWRKSGKHNDSLWTAGGEKIAEETEITSEEFQLVIPQGTRLSQRGSKDCAATAYAIGLSIVTGEPHDSAKYFYNGQANYTDGGIVDQGGNTETTDGADPVVIYKNLMNRKPTVIHYMHDGKGWQHYVIVIGIRKGADIRNLSLSDFIIADPADGMIKGWDEAHPGDGSMRPCGIMEFE